MNKITANHLSRSAYVYVRQSTADQVTAIFNIDITAIEALAGASTGRQRSGDCGGV
jgi:hypothetical protein